jgi:hypothetical protein
MAFLNIGGLNHPETKLLSSNDTRVQPKFSLSPIFDIMLTITYIHEYRQAQINDFANTIFSHAKQIFLE